MRGSRAVGPQALRGTHVLSWLQEEGLLSAAQREGVVYQAERTGRRVEDAILEVGVTDEATLLKLLAAKYGTRFVSTERLAKASVDRATLEMIPHELVRRLRVFPVVFDRRTQSLSIVVAAPGEDDVEKQVRAVSGVRELKSYVARPAAIDAAIAKFYESNHRAFLDLTRPVREEQGLEGLESARGAPPPGDGSDFADPFSDLMGPAPARQAARPTPAPRRAPPTQAPPVSRPSVRVKATLPLDGVIPGDLSSLGPRVELGAYLETLNVFVTLLERERGELKGHSNQVARVCRKLADRVGLPATDRHALLVAAYLHDVGKTVDGHHLTALNIAQYETHRTQAQKTLRAPSSLFASASLPADAVKILGHMYERWDGGGFPDRLSGKDIPYGSRVLSIVETYCDLVGNSQNPYRRVLSVPQALSVLRELGGQLFDPNLAEVLVHLAVGEQADEAMAARRGALLVDPDPEETSVVELRLLEHGFRVVVVRDFASAVRELAEPPDVVITEVDLGGGSSGFDLMKRVHEIDDSKRPALIFLTSRTDRESVSKGFALGAADYLTKPTTPELVAAKARQAADTAARSRAGGVSGSLKEMSLPDVVQILCSGRRGGRLQIVSGGQRGEVHFSDGQIHEAMLGDLRGELAFYALLGLTDGTFSLDPSFSAGERVIQTSPEGLLLEGMRRLDEGLL